MAKKEGKERSTVFISYSHDSPEHADRVLALANKLRSEGIDAILDQYEESPPEGWPMWMDRNIRAADFVLMICTETYYKRVMGEEEPGKGLGVRWEGKLIYQHIYQADAQNTRFIPVLFEGGEVGHIPMPVQDATRYYVDTELGYEKLYRRLTDQLRVKKPEIGKIRKLPSLPERERREDYLKPSVWFSKQWPATDAGVFGRDEELQLLDGTWKEDKVRVLSFVAAGGVGKTALVNRWVNFHMLPDSWRGAECVFGWSFYSQGSEIGRQVSGDDFIKQALLWFGDEETANSTKAPAEKGCRLAELVKKKRTLLLLDGMEPLQEPPNSKTGHEGQIRDQAVSALIRSLARGDSGLCVISTRVQVEDIISYTDEGGTAVQKDLDDLTPEKGAEYLKSLGVHGTQKELIEASKEYGNHALALTLLGHFLKIHRDGDVCRRDEIANVLESRKYRDHAQRMMAFYEEWFKGKAELELLYVLGLFDRPVEIAAIDAVCGNDAIEGLTDKLNGLPGNEWNEVLNTLRQARLVAKGSSRKKLDCHPLIREHFGEKLKNERIDAWREAHGRLYEYYKGVPEKEEPDTLEEMEPLFRAVYHGCAAGEPTKVWEEVYWQRIRRASANYCCDMLGAFGSGLGVVACFFERCWDKPAAGLSEHRKALVLSFAGFRLRALGRLREAAEPMEAAANKTVNRGDWENAAIVTSTLSEMYLTLGEVEKAVEYGHRSVEYADKSGDVFQQFKRKCRLANSFLHAGKILEAEKEFKEAETLRKQLSPHRRFMVSVEGFLFCDLLLEQGQLSQVEERGLYSLKEYSQKRKVLLDIALDKLSLGRSYLLRTVVEKTSDYTKAEDFLNQAVNGLRKAGTQHHIPRGLFARAGYYRCQRGWDRAWGDLEEVREIAERGEMKLHLADYHLESLRLCLAQAEDRSQKSEVGISKEKEEGKNAKRHYEEARRLIEECGYHRRDEELEELNRGLEN